MRVFRFGNKHGFLDAGAPLFLQVFGDLQPHFVVGDMLKDNIGHFWCFDGLVFDDAPHLLDPVAQWQYQVCFRQRAGCFGDPGFRFRGRGVHTKK